MADKNNSNSSENTVSQKFNNKDNNYSDSLRFTRRCMSFKEFQKMQEESAEPDIDLTGNNVEYKKSGK